MIRSSYSVGIMYVAYILVATNITHASAACHQPLGAFRKARVAKVTAAQSF